MFIGKCKYFLTAIVLIVFLIITSSCDNAEKEARGLLNQAVILKKAGKADEAAAILDTLKAKYIQTAATTEAINILQNTPQDTQEVAFMYNNPSGQFDLYLSNRNANANANADANADVKNAYTSSQAYFSDNPDGTVTPSVLSTYGFTQTSNVTVAVRAGTMSTLSLSATSNNGSVIYHIDSTGLITKLPK